MTKKLNLITYFFAAAAEAASFADAKETAVDAVQAAKDAAAAEAAKNK